MSVSVEIQNNGTAPWEKNNLSLNVVGGTGPNAVWYHPIWVTKLRPALVASAVQPNQNTMVSFTITIPKQERRLRLQLVRNNNGNYVQVGTDMMTIILSEIVPIPAPKSPVTNQQTRVNEQTNSSNTLSPIPQINPQMPIVPVASPQRVGGGGGSSHGAGDGEEGVVTTTPDLTPTSTDETPTSTDETTTSTEETPTSTEETPTTTESLPALTNFSLACTD